MLADDVQNAASTEVKTAFPRLAQGANSGAIFLMTSENSGYAITNGTDCFMQEGTRVSSMEGMREYRNDAMLQAALAKNL